MINMIMILYIYEDEFTITNIESTQNVNVVTTYRLVDNIIVTIEFYVFHRKLEDKNMLINDALQYNRLLDKLQ